MASSSRIKRKLEEERDDYSAGIENEMNKYMTNPSKKKHTLDSDSEEEEEEDYNKRKYDVLKDDDIEGQEDGTEEFDGETKITPFNMKDEMEEGYFDGQGMYIWNKKDAGEIKDSWLDSIDWVKIKKSDTIVKTVAKEEEDDESSDEASNPIDLYKQVVSILQPGESILKAIKRLGAGKTLSASERLKLKKLAKQQGSAGAVPTQNQSSADKEKLEKLTSLADQIMTVTGNMDVYDETYESLSFKISEATKPPPPPKEAPKMAEDDGSDMFADDFAVDRQKV